MYQKAGLKWNKKMRIFITHMHGDHCLGLLGILQTMSLQGRDESITIFGPPGLEEFLVENMRMLGFVPKFPLAISEISGNGQVLETKEYTVAACSSEHGVKAFAYSGNMIDQENFIQKKRYRWEFHVVHIGTNCSTAMT